MSVTAIATFKVKQIINNMISWVRVAVGFLKRKNPVLIAYANAQSAIKDFLTVNTRLKLVKYRVNHMQYRLNQMETLIEENASSKLRSGNSIDTFR